MSDPKGEALSRGEMLKKMREARAESVERTQALFREQRTMEQAICRFIRDSPKTVPEIAVEIGKPTSEVLWFVAALRKYGVVVETGMCGDYPLYQRPSEAKP